MKIICVLGSPRRAGNSATLAGQLCQQASSMGAEVESYQLNDMTYRGCQGCYGCKNKHEHCVVKDDLQPVLDGAFEADALVLASPIYYGDVSGQMKLFIDRTFSWLVPDFHARDNPSRLPGGKKAVMILTQGYPDAKAFADVFPKYERFLKLLGFDEPKLIRAVGVHKPGEVMDHPDLLEQAINAAKEIMK